MNDDESGKIATVGHLNQLYKNLLLEMRKMIRQSNRKEFLTPKEFSQIIGLGYYTVIRHCNTGKIMAIQESGDRGNWIIPYSEVDRLIEQANENITE